MTEWVDRPLALDHAVKLALDHAVKLRDLALPPDFFVLSLATLLDAWRKSVATPNGSRRPKQRLEL